MHHYTYITNEIITERRKAKRLARLSRWFTILSFATIAGYILGHVLAFYLVYGGHAVTTITLINI